MKLLNTAYVLIYRKLTAVVLLLLIFLSLFQTRGRFIPITCCERTTVDARNTNDVEFATQNSTKYISHSLARGKFKVKDFFRKQISSVQSLTADRTSIIGLQVFSFRLFTVKPGYYDFLFRYTPF